MNEIWGKMRKKAMSRIWIGLLCLVLAFVFFMGSKNLLGYLTAKENVLELNTGELQTVTDGNSTIPEVYTLKSNRFLDYYGTDDEGYYFIMPTKDEKFMGCFIYTGTEKATALQIVDQYQSYIIGEADAEPNTFVEGKGYVYEMASQEKQYFKEYMDAFFEAAGVGNGEDYLVYKTFVLAPMSKIVGFSDYFMAILCVIFLIIGIWYPVSFFTGGYKKQPEKYIAAYSISESELAGDLTYSIHKKNIDIGRKYAMCYGQTSYLIPYAQLLWTYVHITKTRHKTYGITTNTTYTYQVYFAMRDGKKYDVVVKTEDEGQEIVKEICEAAPHVIGGFHEELDKMFNKNVNDVIRIVEEHKEELARKEAGLDETAAAEGGFTSPDSVRMPGYSADNSEADAYSSNDSQDTGFSTDSSQSSGLDADTFGTPSGSSSGFKLKDE